MKFINGKFEGKKPAIILHLTFRWREELTATPHCWCPKLTWVQEETSQTQGRKIQSGLISTRDHPWRQLIAGVRGHTGEAAQHSCPFLIFSLGICCWSKARGSIWTQGLSLNSRSQRHRSQPVPAATVVQQPLRLVFLCGSEEGSLQCSVIFEIILFICDVLQKLCRIAFKKTSNMKAKTTLKYVTYCH